ncbi:hypothetical protein GCM10022234_27460 [Aeromicrobium panaciterrae]|uniref:Flp family type IVb pilin n=1 Tax=Aeromicrobium panaciterrae TaxID=363861 RepID=UPI0031D66FF7
MNNINPGSPIGFLMALLHSRVDRTRDERGASAVEWVIIAAIVVGICLAVAVILRAALVGEAGDIGNKIQSQ